MAIRVVRTKIIAVFLGPAGVGIEALLDSVVSLARMLGDLGIQAAGVRQIAAATSASDREAAIVRTATTLRRACLILGMLSAAVLWAWREAISNAAFGTNDQAANIGLLSVILVLGATAGGQAAILNGMRKIGDLARMTIWGSVLGTAVTIPIVVLMGRDGIVVYMIVGAVITRLVSWYYGRRLHLPRIKLPLRVFMVETLSMLRLGVAFLTAAAMSNGALFILRVLVTRTHGVEAAGQFQAASALSVVYVGFILQAMGTDFFPRLTAVAGENERCNAMVNEQTEVSFILALPGLLATQALAPLVIRLFYSADFNAAALILIWQMAGMLLRLASWPLGYILMAKGKGLTFVITDAAAWVVYVVLAWFGLRFLGLPGMGLAFFGLYVFYYALIYLVVRSVSGFRWSRPNFRLMCEGAAAMTVVLSARLCLDDPWGTVIGVIVAAVAGIHCFRLLIRVTDVEPLSRFMGRFSHGLRPSAR